MIIFIADKTIYRNPSELPADLSKSISGAGDYCLLKEKPVLYKFIAIDKTVNSVKDWSQFPILDKFSVAGISFQSSLILFSYDLSNGRYGNNKDLQTLKTFCNSIAIKNLIENAIEILNFKTDSWDAQVVISILSLTAEKRNKTKEKKSIKKNPNLPFFNAVLGETIPWLEIKRFDNLHITPNTPLSFLFRTNLINKEVFSFGSSNDLVYISDIIEAYINFANFSAYSNDSEYIEEVLKKIILYAAQKGWVKLYSGEESKTPFTSKRSNIEEWLSKKAERNNDIKTKTEIPNKLSQLQDKVESCQMGHDEPEINTKESTPQTSSITINKPSVIIEDRHQIPDIKKSDKTLAEQQYEFAEKQKEEIKKLFAVEISAENNITESFNTTGERQINRLESPRSLIEKYVDNRFIKISFLLEHNIIDIETYKFLENNNFTSINLLLSGYNRYSRMKKRMLVYGHVLEQIETLIDYSIEKKWIFGIKS